MWWSGTIRLASTRRSPRSSFPRKRPSRPMTAAGSSYAAASSRGCRPRRDPGSWSTSLRSGHPRTTRSKRCAEPERVGRSGWRPFSTRPGRARSRRLASRRSPSRPALSVRPSWRLLSVVGSTPASWGSIARKTRSASLSACSPASVTTRSMPGRHGPSSRGCSLDRWAASCPTILTSCASSCSGRLP